MRQEILHPITEAEHSILILTFTLSDPKIMSLLKQKAQEGVDVTVIIDKDHLQPILGLKGDNFHIYTRLYGEGRVHHKILVIDEEYVWIGSANFTESAYSKQENLMVGIYSQNSPSDTK